LRTNSTNFVPALQRQGCAEASLVLIQHKRVSALGTAETEGALVPGRRRADNAPVTPDTRAPVTWATPGGVHGACTR
jgi:hypothetical protein